MRLQGLGNKNIIYDINNNLINILDSISIAFIYFKVNITTITKYII